MNEKLNTDQLFILVSLFFFLLLVFLIVITLAIRYRKRKRENEDLKIAFAQTLLKSRLEIQEQTLQHISREIHDNLGQVASLIKINLNTLQPENVSDTNRKIENTRELVRQLITDLKHLSTTLNTDKITKKGLVKALEFESERLKKTGLFNSVFTQHDNIPVIEADKTIILYRMSQEIINNSIKHADARNINMDLYYKGNIFTLVIADDGIGFDVNARINDNIDSGNGLGNLISRAKIINAEIKFLKREDKGTEVKIIMSI